MAAFMRLLASERLKLSRSFIWLLVPISPLLSLLLGIVSNPIEGMPAEQYEGLYSYMALFHAVLLLPILTGVFAAFVCRYEHAGGGWKQLLALPISRKSLYFAKFWLVSELLIGVQLLFLAAVLITGAVRGLHEIPWNFMLLGLLGGWLACLPLAALQLWVSTSWSSFAAPLTINVMLTLPNMLVINSAEYGPFYPWVQPTIAMLVLGSENYGAFTMPVMNLFMTIIGSLLLFIIGGLIYFRAKEI
ncbi:ABC transporter permease [Paenibacillus algorifonticola]|uniref:ABC transporter permease n=1 Tax=Paenibacillus algorifonticola TaxID=684063 RepID=UPI003D2694FE